jgi:hypothetical protein
MWCAAGRPAILDPSPIGLRTGFASTNRSAATALTLTHLDTRYAAYALGPAIPAPIWLPNGDAIIYETPRDLVPLPLTGRRRVWSAHLVRFDLATRTEAGLTSGVTNNVQPNRLRTLSRR